MAKAPNGRKVPQERLKFVTKVINDLDKKIEQAGSASAQELPSKPATSHAKDAHQRGGDAGVVSALGSQQPGANSKLG